MSQKRNNKVVKTSEEDFLTADQNVPGQNYVCLSFVSPEKILKQKEVFKMLSFIKEKYKIDKKYEDLDEDYKSYLVNKRVLAHPFFVWSNYDK